MVTTRDPVRRQRRASTEAAAFLPRAALPRLVELLRGDGRRVMAPVVRDEAVVYDEIESAADLPTGWGATQEPGRVRLERRDDDRVFDGLMGPGGWKGVAFPSREPLFSVSADEDGVTVERRPVDSVPTALLGVRPCELTALGIHDRVLQGGPVVDPRFATRREGTLTVAVECASAQATCFCTSMGTGPEATDGFDLALLELEDGFVVRTGSEAGAAVVAELGLQPADPAHIEERAAVLDRTRASMAAGLGVELDGLRERLAAASDSTAWDAVAERCLACANCTLVCPTCFCTGVEQTAGIDGSAEATRAWDSCFTLGFARVAGGNFRPRVRDRYRQWLTHKFSTWWDQFGSAGCVGCGRCIAWCPVGIDVRAELARIAPAPEPAVAAALAAAVEEVGVPNGAISNGLATAPRPAIRAPLPILPPDAGHAQELADYRPATVVARHPETHDTVTLRLRTEDERMLAGRPGQFVMIARPTFPIPPISVSRYHPDGLELTIRAAGPSTRALAGLARGDGVALRGPLGRSWPIDLARGKDVVVVTGGIGLAPLRPVLDAVLAERDAFRSVRLLYGARTPADRLFVDELAALEGRDDVEVGTIVDRAGPDWLGRVGVVTALFDHLAWDGPNTVAYVCGPERMMEAVASGLQARGVAPDRIMLSLERNMACGVGLCGHCQLGPFFVCRDGPVFSLAELGPWFGREGV